MDVSTTSAPGTVTVCRVDESIAEQVLDLLEEFNHQALSRSVWKRILSYDWKAPESHRGFALMDEDRVVGFLGTVLSERHRDGRTVRFCNLTGWIVKEAYRNYSLRLLTPLLKMRDYTITNFSSYDRGVEMMKRFGFTELDTMTHIIPVLPWSGSLRRKGWRTTTSVEAMAEILDEEDQRILADHAPYDCLHYVLHGASSAYCYVVLTYRQKLGLRYYYVHYVSNPSLFVEALSRIRSDFLWKQRAVVLLIDARYLMGQKVPLAIARRCSVPRLYRAGGDAAPPSAVDSLYSEWILLR